MIIRKITLKNFQIHKTLSLDLDEFTAIVGPSSAGKSSILRALSWLFYGDWDATYPNDPEQETAVAIQLADGTIWGRYRKAKRNWAAMRKPGEKPMVYQDFGELVPGLLEEFNVRPIKVGTSRVNLNFSMQDDPIFMVHESKPAKAQWIGRLYGAHLINQMLRLASKDKRAIEADKKMAEDEESRLRAELSKYEGLDEQADALARTKELIVRLSEMLACRDSMASVLQDYESIKKGSHFLEADTEGMRTTLARIELLRVAQDESLSVQREEWALNQTKHLLNADTESIRNDLATLKESTDRLNEYRSLAAEFEAATKDRHAMTNRMEGLIPMLEARQSSMKENLFAEGRCPLCSSKPKKLDMDAVTYNLRELVRSI
jgi:DNA repair exonuclease SbcCD ATPase subunit